jgi:fructosamine-3-kinase
VLPNFCPTPRAHGPLARGGGFFLVTDFLDLKSSGPSGSGISLAEKLATLHLTPAPALDGQFGFPVPTCCGSTVQDNSWRSSWADFYADCRIRAIGKECTRRQGIDYHLQEAVEVIATRVVPRLLGEGTMKATKPVVIHGDLWCGNHGRGKIGDIDGVEEVVFDPSCVYGHPEYELGIMRIFGGFDSDFWTEYHERIPKAEPVEEWEDRMLLYEL